MPVSVRARVPARARLEARAPESPRRSERALKRPGRPPPPRLPPPRPLRVRDLLRRARPLRDLLVRPRTVLHGEPEVRCQTRQSGGVPLPHGAELPPVVPPVELAQQDRGLRGRVLDDVLRELLPGGGAHGPQVQALDLSEGPAVAGRRDHDPVHGRLDAAGVDLQPVGDHPTLTLRMPRQPYAASRVLGLVVEHQVAPAPDLAARVDEQRRRVGLRRPRPTGPAHDGDPHRLAAERKVSPLMICVMPAS